MNPRSKGSMRISIIIPVLNEAERIVESVERAWAAGASEVLVVDGGSTDGTTKIASGLDCRILTSERGRAIQQNTGAKAASGEILLFLHADNWLAANAISQIHEALAQPGRLHGAFRQQIEARGIGFRALEWGNARRVQWLGIPYGDQGIFVRRDLFLELGGFPAVQLMEDVMLSKRLRQKARPQLLPGPLHVDARRWIKHGILQQTMRNWTLLMAHQVGIPPDSLAKFYARHDK